MAMDDMKGERIAKIIARAGLCSRREAEVLVAEGRVALDGRTVREPGTTVRPGQRVTVDGEALPALEPPRLFRFHKPVGVLTTAKDPQGRETFYDGLPDGLPRLMPVGRLDINSEGLLLLTNDGGLKRHLELPGTGWLRRYRVRVYGRVDEAALAALKDGVTVEGVRYGPIQARLDSQQASNAWLTFALQEGKNREIRQVCRHLGLQVNRLIRVAYGPFQLGALPEGGIEEVPQKALKEQLGAFLTDLSPPPQRTLSPPPQRTLSPPGRGQGEGQGNRQRAPHPGPLPARGERGDLAAGAPLSPRRKPRAEAPKPVGSIGVNPKGYRGRQPKSRDGDLDTARSPGQQRRRPSDPPSRGPGGARRRG